MRILLLKPYWAIGYGQMRYAKRVRFPVLALGILAAMSRDHDVQIVDANWDEIPWDQHFDLVGITCTTFASEEAYRIARHFRGQGAKVVIGGVHPTILPEEARHYVDSVVVGEAEYLWNQILADAERNQLKSVYRAPRATDMADTPSPRRELLGESPWFTAVEASRGCPNRCRYCYLPETPWASFRPRPIEKVVEEIAGLPQKIFILVDENLFTDRDHALRLFREMAPLKKHWLIQMPTDRADDDELLDAMAEAGCFNVHMGFQSFNEDSLKDAQVDHAPRVGKYKEIVQRLHERKIVVSGFFVFGFDGDRPGAFRSTVDAIQDIGVDDAGMFIATPYPGTGFYAHFQDENRLLDDMPRDAFGWSRAVFQPKHMTPEELETGVQWAYDSLNGHFKRRLLWVMRKQLPVVLKEPRLGAAFVLGTMYPHHVLGRASTNEIS